MFVFIVLRLVDFGDFIGAVILWSKGVGSEGSVAPLEPAAIHTCVPDLAEAMAATPCAQSEKCRASAAESYLAHVC